MSDFGWEVKEMVDSFTSKINNRSSSIVNQTVCGRMWKRDILDF